MASPFQIGSFEFVRFNNQLPPSPKPQFNIETRPGVDGFAAIYTGNVGEPFTIEAESIFDTFANAVIAAKSYEAAPTLTPFSVIWESINLSSVYNVNFLLQGVVIREIQSIPLFMSATSAIEGGTMVYSSWTLIPRAI